MSEIETEILADGDVGKLKVQAGAPMGDAGGRSPQTELCRTAMVQSSKL